MESLANTEAAPRTVSSDELFPVKTRVGRRLETGEKVLTASGQAFRFRVCRIVQVVNDNFIRMNCGQRRDKVYSSRAFLRFEQDLNETASSKTADSQ